MSKQGIHKYNWLHAKLTLSHHIDRFFSAMFSL